MGSKGRAPAWSLGVKGRSGGDKGDSKRHKSPPVIEIKSLKLK